MKTMVLSSLLIVIEHMCLLTNKQYIESDQDLDNLRRCLYLKYYLYKNMYFGYLLKFIRNSSFFTRGKHMHDRIISPKCEVWVQKTS